MNASRLKVLLIEDNPGDAELLGEMLCAVDGAAFALERTERLATGLARLAVGDIDVVLLDLSLPDSQGLDTFLRAHGRARSVPIVVLSGSGDEALAIRAVHEGAQDYLVKGEVNSQLLARSLHYAIERKHAEKMLARTAAELTRSNQQLQQLAADMEKLASAEHEARVKLERTHKQLLQTQGQLVQSAKLAALGQLVAGIAHEINNPLAFVTNDAAVLWRETRALGELVRLYRQAEDMSAEQQPDLQRRIRAFAEQIELAYTLEHLEPLVLRLRDGLQRIGRIVADLRDFARSEAMTDVHDGVDVNAGIASTVNIIRGRAKGQKVDLEMDLGPLPPIACSVARINQVVLNLLANAIDACAAGGKVTVRTRAAPGGIEIQVLDTGAGIDPAIRDQIFDPFFTTKPPGQGTGLGLSISHGIIEDHGGRIVVDSSPGHGAHFTVYLPAQLPQS